MYRAMLFKRSFAVIRRSKRQWLNTSVRVLTDRGHMDAVGLNLSEGGMGLFAVAHLPVGSQVQVEFRPPQSSESIRVHATIKHRALYLYGVEFISHFEKSSDIRTAHASTLDSARC